MSLYCWDTSFTDTVYSYYHTLSWKYKTRKCPRKLDMFPDEMLKAITKSVNPKNIQLLLNMGISSFNNLWGTSAWVLPNAFNNPNYVIWGCQDQLGGKQDYYYPIKIRTMSLM